MFRFFRESVKEFDHVVWPTRAETVRYFQIVLATISVLAVFLFLLGTAFSNSLFALRGAIAPTSSAPVSTAAQNEPASDIDLNALLWTGASVDSSALPATESVPVTPLPIEAPVASGASAQ